MNLSAVSRCWLLRISEFLHLNESERELLLLRSSFSIRMIKRLPVVTDALCWTTQSAEGNRSRRGGRRLTDAFTLRSWRLKSLQLTWPGRELSQTMTSSSAATSGGLSLVSRTWTVTGTWLKRSGLPGGAESRRVSMKLNEGLKSHNNSQSIHVFISNWRERSRRSSGNFSSLAEPAVASVEFSLLRLQRCRRRRERLQALCLWKIIKMLILLNKQFLCSENKKKPRRQICSLSCSASPLVENRNKQDSNRSKRVCR